MGRNRKYATPEEAHEAKLAQAREKYRLSRVGVERKKWGFINTVITEDMIGKTIKELETEYKSQHPSKSKKTLENEVENEVENDSNNDSKNDSKNDAEQNLNTNDSKDDVEN